ncbi:4-oxalocrotonate tautomerase [Methylobacterium indicum]|uniref:tautomerase family protein n=1 Tax=Methylobacterium indicum TaxID=1775910 RepID=UPI000734D343|nr:tautomerase family protein [Methylobacterium indicum]KTS36972.1 4-oxalocrotonate tautomerase [Methylobacterium indicum]KTS41364.1 4-oxalocrotonate tautomerase [Methylobacterium indicum]KTS53711.1 4-oxalocrotonate tautomerase [Methylobacterium indicum]
MPHVIVKLYAGRSDEQKQRIADEVTKALITATGCSEGSVSVGVEDVAPSAWTATVYEPDIVAKADTILKKPGYAPA